MPVIPTLTLPNNGDDAVVDQYNAAFQVLVALLNGGLDDDNIADGSIILSKLATAVQQALVPVGTVLAYGGSTAPSAGFLLCYGQAVSRSTYSSLFAILGTAFGVGDGSTTFNLPDLRGRVPVGLDNIGGTAANRIQRTSTITTTNGSATATIGSATGISVGMYVESANVPDGITITAISGTTLTLSTGSGVTAGTTTAARFSLYGDAQEMGDAGGTDVHQLITAQIAAHTHVENISVGTADGGSGGTIVRSTTAPNGTNSANSTASSGDDQSHPNLQPAQLMNYIIKV